MATDCSDGIYTLNYTNLDKTPITINKKTLNQSILDIALLGRTRKEYGEVFDENILHLLENFASEEDPTNPGNPDLSRTYADLLVNPIQGQKWFNKTQGRLFHYDGQFWNGLGGIGDIGGNSGIIAHGASLPLPISASTNYHFTYDECTWIVSMFNYPDQTSYAKCTTDTNGLVTSQYKVVGSDTLINGYAFYQILGLKGVGTDALPSPTPTPTPSLTPSVTPSITITRTPAPSATLTPSVSQSISPTPTPSVTLTPSNTPPVSPTPATTLTPTPSVTPSQVINVLPINGNEYDSFATAVDGGGTWTAGSQLTVQFNTDGTYTISRVTNGTTDTPVTGTWLPVGDAASNYTIVLGLLVDNQSNGTNGNASSSNSAPTPTLMTSANETIFFTSFSYTGVSIPGGITGGSISGSLNITLTNITNNQKTVAAITLAASAGPSS